MIIKTDLLPTLTRENEYEGTMMPPQNINNDFEALDSNHNRTLLLRVWAEKSGQSAKNLLWRYSLQDLSTKAQRGFASLEVLSAYLEGMEREVSSITKNKFGDKE
jgi:hypothetical protein